jgi:dihydrofolate synthase/folylpolyglutamate synthase
MTARPRNRADGRALSYLASRVRFGMKFGLDTIRSLMESLGHPERACPTLLVAGTNGKGSVVAYVDAALRASGLRTGRYTSPHLVRVNERITVDGRPISDRTSRAGWPG